MALSILSGDELEVIFIRLCNPFDTRVAMAFGSASRGLWAPTQVARQQLRVQSELAAALCQKAGIPSCKKLREATTARWSNTELSMAELAMLGALGSVVPSLRSLYLFDNVAEPGGMQRLAAGLGAGSLPCVTRLVLGSMRMGDAGAVALAAALNRGALARLEALSLGDNGIGDAGLVALAPALRRLPSLKQLWLVGTSRCREHGLSTAEQASASMAPRRVRQSQGVPRRRLGAISLTHSCSGHYPYWAALMLAGLTAPSSDPGNPLGDRGLAALVAPPLTGALTQLEVLNVDRTQVRAHNCNGHICYCYTVIVVRACTQSTDLARSPTPDAPFSCPPSTGTT